MLARCAPALLVLAALAAPAPAAAQSAPATNRTELTLTGSAAKQLRAAGVRISVAKPGRATSSKLTLPASGVMIETARDVTITHKPTLTFRAGKRTLKVTVPQLVADGSRSSVTGVVGSRSVTLLRVTTAKRRKIDSARGRIAFTAAPVRLTAAGAKLLRTRLGLRTLRAGAFGRLTSDVDVTVSGMPPLAPVDGPPTPGGATLSAAPPTARPITGGTVAYSPKASWLGYIAQEGQGATAEDGASFASGTYQLPITGGWYDPASGGAVVQTGGSTRFTFTGHQIDVALQNWAFDLTSSNPKVVTTVKACLHCSILGHTPPGTLLPLLLAKPADLKPTATAAAVSWANVPLTLANEGVPLFLAYLYDSDQGRATINATF